MRTRVASSVALAALVLLSTTACNFVAPQATLKQYDPSDGVGTTVGDVKVLNAILLTETGEEASLLASFVNQGTERVQVTMQYESGSDDINTDIMVPAGGTTSVGTEAEMQLVIEDIDALPGGLFPLYFQYGDNPGQLLMVPVLDGTLPTYEGLLP